MPSQRVCAKNDLPEIGASICVRVNFKPIAIYNVEGAYFALADYCTHEKASLSEIGYIEGDMVECSLHGAQFHIPTGKVLRLPATEPLATYIVTIDGDDVLIDY